MPLLPMRPLPLLVCCEAVVLMILAILWFQRSADAGPVEVPRVAGGAEAVPGGEARSGGTGVAATGARGTEAVPPRQAVPGEDAGSAPSDIVVRGRLLTSDGSEPPAEPSVLFYQGATYRRATLLGGEYAIASLSPGTWEAQVREAGWASLVEEHVLTSEPVQTIDLTLTPAYRVDVFVTGPGQVDLQSTMSELGLLWGLHVVATGEPLVGDLPVTEQASVGDLGLGRYQMRGGLGGDESERGESGVLWLDRPPPANAALLMRHVVLAQQGIAAGQRELRFVVDPERLRARFPSVSLRVIDGTTGQALTEGVQVGFSTAQGGGFGRPTVVGDRLVVENVMPGMAQMELSAGLERERVTDSVLVPSGGELDLGDVVLGPKVEALGRLLDSEGRPTAGSLQWTCLDRWDPPAQPLVDRRTTRANADGEFALHGVGPHRYVVTAYGGEPSEHGHAIVDVGALGGERFEVRLHPAGAIAVEAPADTLKSWSVVVLDPDRVPVAVAPIRLRYPRAAARVAAGPWTVEVYEVGGGVVMQEEVEVPAGGTVRLEVK